VRACLIRRPTGLNALCQKMCPCTHIRAFKTYVRPILECASCVWSPTHTNAIKLIDSVQRKFTKRLPGCSHLDYASRLERSNMESLELKRLYSDYPHIPYKILFELTSITTCDLFLISKLIHNTRLANYLKPLSYKMLDNISSRSLL